MSSTQSVLTATKAHHEGTRKGPLVTLMSLPLRSFSTKEGGLHVLHTKRPRHSTPSRRDKDDCR
jgi:hypothetical protein